MKLLQMNLFTYTNKNLYWFELRQWQYEVVKSSQFQNKLGFMDKINENFCLIHTARY